MFPVKTSKKARVLKTKADEAYTAQKWKKALELYQELDQEAPDDIRVMQRVGDICRRLHQNEEAIDYYKRVATVFASQGFWAKAIAINKIILEVDPQDLSVQRALAKMYSSHSKSGPIQTIPDAVPADTVTPKKIEERAAISIAGDEPRRLDEQEELVIGGTISIAGSQPRTMEEEPVTLEEEISLGKPEKDFKKIPLFSEMDVEELIAVLEKLNVRKFSRESLICEEGDLGRSMYIISEGEVEVFSKDPAGGKLILGKLGGGDFFGEFGLLTNGERNASVQAKTDVELLEITSHAFDVIATKYPRIWIVLEDYLKRRLIHNILVKSSVFRYLNADDREKLAGLLTTKKVLAGDVVMNEGSAGEEMFFVKQGSLRVTVGQGTTQSIVLGELVAGDYFGEVAALTGKPRTATVRAKVDCELFVLTRKDAASVLKGNREVLLQLKGKMDERAQDAVAAFQSYQEARSTLNLV